MKKYLIVLLLLLAGCGSDIFIPDVVEAEGYLSAKVQALAETVLEEEMCNKIKKKGYPCNIQTQMHVIRFEWDRTEEPTRIKFRIKFCREDCPHEME